MRRLAILVPLALIASLAHGEGDERAFELVRAVSEQLGQGTSMRAEYDVTYTSEGAPAPIKYQVKYVKDGDRFNFFEQRRYADTDKVWTYHKVSNGTSVVSFNADEGFASIARVRPETGDGPLGLAGIMGVSKFTADYRERKPEEAFTLVGEEDVGGRTCTKVLLKSSEEENAFHTYFWIDTSGGQPRLLRTQCYGEAGGHLLHDISYEYDASRASTFPTRIVRVEGGQQKGDPREGMRETRMEVVVRKVEVGAAIENSEFEFPFTKGMRVQDEIRHVTYDVGGKVYIVNDIAVDEFRPSMTVDMEKEESNAAEGIAASDSQVAAQGTPLVPAGAEGVGAKEKKGKGTLLLGLAIAVVVAAAVMKGLRARKSGG